MKKIALVALFLVILPLTYAEINVDVLLDYYNIGDVIGVSASVLPEADINGFIKFTLRCESTTVPYYLTPIDLQEGFRTQVEVPDLTAMDEMEGMCSIASELFAVDNKLVDGAVSKQFEVSDGLEIILVKEEFVMKLYKNYIDFIQIL